MSWGTPGKNNLFRKSNAHTNGLHLGVGWKSPLARVIEFLNKLFLLGVGAVTYSNVQL